MVTKPLNIMLPRYCACCWRPVTEKNKKGRPENYCSQHKPEGNTKRDYMKTRRAIEKALAHESNITAQPKVKLSNTESVDALISALAVNPNSLNITDITSGKTLIDGMLNITSRRYELAFEQLKELGDYIEQPNLSIGSVLLAVHVALGTNKLHQAKTETSVYDTKKESNVWFIQLLFTLARYEAFAVIAKRASVKKTRSDKDLVLRASIKKEVDLAKIRKQKPNQSSIAKKLKISKQRVGKLIQELYPAQKGDRKCDRLAD